MAAKLGFFNKYLFSSMFLNGLFKSYDIYDAKVKRVNNETTNLLMAEKITIVSIHTLAGPYILPFRVYDLINRMELKLRGENYYKYYSVNYLNDYSGKKESIDYICNPKKDLTIIEHIFKFY